MKQILLLLLLLSSAGASAQLAHNTNCPQCAFSKNRVKDATRIGTANESCGCAACGDKRKKEKAARQAEIKRRSDALAAENRAFREAKQRAFDAEQKQMREEAAKPRSGEVVINARKSAIPSTPNNHAKKGQTIAGTRPGAASALLSAKMEYAGSERWSIVTDEKGNVVFKTSEHYVYNWDKRTTSLYLGEPPEEYPKGVVIAQDNTGQMMNLLDSKGKKILPEDNINALVYCGNNFFMYSICRNETPRSCQNESNMFAAESVVLFDFQSGKKTVYEKVGDNDRCLINSRYQVERKPNVSSDNALFVFGHPICSHRKNSRGWMIAKVEVIGVGKDRKPFPVTTTDAEFWPTEH